MQINRRKFLGSALGVSLAGGLLPMISRGFAAAAPPHLKPRQFGQQLRGPIVSIPTPFTAQFEIDREGLRRMIRLALEHHIRIFELTAGDSQFSSLSYDEIKRLSRWVVEDVGSAGITIAGTGAWWTARVVDFAHYVESLGMTALQVLPPAGIDDASSLEHYRTISRNTKLPIVLHGNYSRKLLADLLEIDSIVALKEDVSPSYFIETLIHFGKRLNCFSGGSYQWFLLAQPYGAKAYFDTYSTFMPVISQRFWKAVQAEDLKTETEIVEKYDHPFVADRFSNPFWHATLEYFGVAKRYLRPPQQSYTDQEMTGVKEFFDKLGLYPVTPEGAGYKGVA
jgi:dihydrodipicolinate synthase/N-acetylneuraminate lyase